MRTQVARTSIDAYYDNSFQETLEPKEAVLMGVFQNSFGGSFSRQELSKITEMPINTVCGRVKSLLLKNELIVVGTRFDASTRKSQELLSVPELQGRLF
jgi:hypothetical protein